MLGDSSADTMTKDDHAESCDDDDDDLDSFTMWDAFHQVLHRSRGHSGEISKLEGNRHRQERQC